MEYNFKQIEKKWQQYWQDNKSFEVDIDLNKPKYYVLEMFPYPSGRIHMGHVRNYTIGDVIARFKKSLGFNVLHPMGWDAFGLPAENAAIENNQHPKNWTYSNIQSMKEQLLPLGFSYDWRREIATCDPSYYKHEQEMFLDFYEKGYAYQKESIVNWDPVDQTVLANEQVENGRGWRSGAIVEKKKLKQWFLKITDFAPQLLADLDTLTDWPQKVTVMQKNWIGKSQGAEIEFKLTDGGCVKVYTTRPETLFGVSFIAISYDHPLLDQIDNHSIRAFAQKCSLNVSTEEVIETADKEGIFTGFYAINPFDESKKIPVYIANYVLSYGCGAIFGCPAHDQRDHDFAIKYSLPIIGVVKPCNQDHDFNTQPYLENGTMINSEFLNGLDVEQAKQQAIEKIESLNIGTRKIQYRLRDWGVSRQRYWGCPIPIVYCNSCGVVKVPKDQLPVELPAQIELQGLGNPLDTHQEWKYTNCPKCAQPAIRETDTFDTFFESSWYFARFCCPQSNQAIDKNVTDYWLPVDQYIGGIEHAVLHLLYARFFTKALNKCDYISITEPFKRLLTQGMICHETYKSSDGQWLYPDEIIKRDGFAYSLSDNKSVSIGKSIKMSKSKKNVINPKSVLDKYGADTVRFFLLSDSPPDRDIDWSFEGIEGAYRYLSKLPKLINATSYATKVDTECLKLIHKTIKDVTDHLEIFHFNKAIAKIRELTNYLNSYTVDESTYKLGVKVVLQLLNPIVPHITEELWQKLATNSKIIDNRWPSYDENYIKDDNVIIAVQVNGKMRGKIEALINLNEHEVVELIQNLSNVKSMLDKSEIKKIIFVPNKIINIIL